MSNAQANFHDLEAWSGSFGDDWIALAADVGRVGFWRLDLATEEIECTQACKRNVGFAPDEPFNLAALKEKMFPEDSERVDAVVAKAAAEQSEYSFDYRVRWPDGSVHSIASRGRFVAEGESGILVGMTMDVTERRAVEQQLAAERDMNQLITQHVAEGLCLLNDKAELTFMNRAAESVIGWTFDEIRGKKLHEIVHQSRRDGSRYPADECPLVQAIFNGNGVVGLEEEFIRKDGTFVTALCSSTPTVVEGKIVGAVLSLHDITEQKKMADALREASRAKDEFLAAISHELRTPMTSVLGWIGYLRLVGIPAEVADAIDHIERSAKAQARIVDDLLDVSRAITGKLRLDVSSVDIHQSVMDAVRAVQPSAEAKRIELAVARTTSDARVIGDPNRLQQVVLNLLSNAIKFTPDGGRVCVSVELTADRVVVKVSDTGIGIPADFLPQVFDRFAQAAGVRMTTGLGLGLAIVKQLVELHGGTVSAHSDGPGLGSTFAVALPRQGE